MARADDVRWRSDDDEEGNERGFTLIELMVVLLIMAILLAIAIPTFYGVRTSAGYRSAQSDLVNATVSIKAIYAGTAQGGYPTAASLVAQAALAEPELTFTTGAAPASPPHHVSLTVSNDGDIVLLSDQSADGHCWYVEINEEQMPTSDSLAGATSAQGVSFAESTATRSTCLATVLGAFSGWGSSFPSY